MLTKNQVCEAVITDYTTQGQGIAHVEGCTVFIPRAIVGETVLVRLTTVKKTWASGTIVKLLTPSPHRREPDCPVAGQCGGCAFWHMDYGEETRLKGERIAQCLTRLGGQYVDQVAVMAASSCLAYRNKAQYPVAQVKGRVFAGFFREGSHEVVENPGCAILPKELDQVKATVVAHANRFRIPAYDEKAHTGLLRHIFVRQGAVSRQVLVALVINGETYPHWQALAEDLKAVPGFACLTLSHNTKKGNTILGDRFTTLYGPGYIEDTLCGLTFRLSARSFYQVNHHQAQRLYEKAVSFASIRPTDTVLDLYCGVGTITLVMARQAGKVIGVEVIPQAVADARDNARRNGIENAKFFCADAGQAALSLEEQGIRPDVIVVDPPRKGLNAEAIEAICRMAPERLVYVSCDPATLARDVKLLTQGGYQLEKLEGADLFPRCAHVETVVLLSKGKSTRNVSAVRTGLADLQ